MPCIQRVSSDEIREAQLESNKIFASHHIASFNYKAWKKYTQLYNIKEAFWDIVMNLKTKCHLKI